MGFCLQLGKRPKIRVKEVSQLSWINLHDKSLQFIIYDIFKFCNNQCPGYFDEIFCTICDNIVITRFSNKKIIAIFSKNKTRNSKLILCGT